MNNKPQSQLCIEISSATNVAGQEVTQKLFVTDLYVYTEILGQQLLYLPEKNKQYLIDIAKEQLVKVDISAQAAQFLQIRQLIGEVSVEEKQIERRKCLHAANINRTNVRLDVEVEVIEFAELEKTVLSKFKEFQSALQLVSLKLNANEIAASMKTNMIANGQIQEINTKILEIKKSDNPCQFDQYFYFPVDE